MELRSLRVPRLAEDPAGRAVARGRRHHAGLSLVREMRAVLADQPGPARSAAMVGREPAARRPLPLSGMSRAGLVAHTRSGVAADLPLQYLIGREDRRDQAGAP